MTAAELQELAESMSRLREMVDGVTATQRIKQIEDEAAAAKLANRNAAAEKAGTAVVRSLDSLGKSLMSTDAGMSKYNAGISSAGNAAFDIGKQFGVLGFALGGFAKLLTMGAELVLKQNDAMIKAYDSLSEFGQTASLTSVDILKLGNASGYTSHNLEIFTKNAVKVSQELAGLAGSASEGLVAFSKLTAITQEQRNSYNRLGQGQEKVTQLQTDYVRQTIQAGVSLSKSPEMMRKSSLAYIDSLNQLAAITGLSVEKQQSAIDVANANENFNAYLFHKGRQRDDLQKQADAEGDTVRGKELQAKADEVSQVIKVKEEYARLAVSTMSATKAAAHMQSIATDGAVVYTSANASILMTGENVDAMNKKMNKGGSAIADLLTSQVDAARKFDKNFGQVGYAFGEHSVELQKIFGVDNKMRETAAEWAKLTTKEEKDAFIAKIAITKKELEDKKNGVGMIDIIKKGQNEQLTVELQARKAMDGLAASIRGPVMSAFTGLTGAMNVFGRAVGTVISWIPGMGKAGEKIKEQFRDPEEVKADIQQAQAEKTALVEQVKRDEKLHAVKLADYNETADKEKKSNDTLSVATAKVAFIRDKEAKATSPDEKRKLVLERSTALIEQSNAKAAHEIDRKALESKKVTNVEAKKIADAKLKIKELENKITTSGATLGRLTGAPTTVVEEEKTVGTDPAVIAARKLLENKELILLDTRNNEKEKLFEAENAGLKWSLENENAKYKTKHEQEAFAKRLAAKLKPDEDEIAALKLSNTKLEKEVEQRLGREMIAKAKSEVTESNKEHGVAQGKQADLSVSSKEHYEKMYASILEAAKKQGVAHPEVIAKLGASQSTLETGGGKHMIGNNAFGIKGEGTAGSNILDTSEVVNGQTVKVKAKFKAFKNLADASEQYVKFLTENKSKRYAAALNATTFEEAAVAIGKSGYATDPNYGAKVATIGASVSSPPKIDVAVATSKPAGADKATTDWAYSVHSGKASIKAVPEKYKTAAFVELLKNPPAHWTPPSPEVVTASVTPSKNVATATFAESSLPIQTPKPSDFAKASQEQVAVSTVNKVNTPVATALPEKANKQLPVTSEMISMMSDKFDMMISQLSSIHDSQDQLLKYSRA